MSNQPSNIFGFGGKRGNQGTPTTMEETPAAMAKEVFSKSKDQLLKPLYSVIVPEILNSGLPSDFSKAKSNQSNPGQPVIQQFNLFDDFEQAKVWAQKQNKPLVILEIKAQSRVVPVLPQIEPIE